MFVLTILALVLGIWRVNESRMTYFRENVLLRERAYQELVFSVGYKDIFLIELDSQVYAIRLMHSTNESVDYQWLRIGKVSDASPNEEWHDAFEAAELTQKGSGIISEVQGETTLVVGPLRIEWSENSRSSGWLYFYGDSVASDSPYSELRVQLQQFADLTQLSRLDPRLWKRVSGYPEVRRTEKKDADRNGRTDRKFE